MAAQRLAAQQAREKERLKKVWRQVDIDGNGSLDHSEVAKVPTTHGYHFSFVLMHLLALSFHEHVQNVQLVPLYPGCILA